MVYFINVDRQTGKLADQPSQLVCLPLVRFFKAFQNDRSVFFFHIIQNDFLRICHGNKPEQVRKWLMIGYFLNIRVFRFVGFFCGFRFVQNFKDQCPFQLRCRGLRDYPGGIKALDRPQAGNNRGFQPRRGKNHKIVGEGGIIRLVLSVVQVQVYEGSHEVGLACAHGKTEKVVCIGNVVKQPVENVVVIYSLRVLPDGLFQLRSGLFLQVILCLRVLKQRCRCGMGLQISPCAAGQFYCVKIQGVENTLRKQPIQRLTAAGDFQIQISLDRLNLRIPKLPFSLHIGDQIMHGTFIGSIPLIPFFLDHSVEHSKPSISSFFILYHKMLQ